MTFHKAFISFLLLIIPISLVQAEGHRAKTGTQKIERSLAVDPAVVMSMCVNSGGIVVRGWNKNEILARSTEVGRIELKHGMETNAQGLPSKVVVWIADKNDSGEPSKSGCQAFGDVELMVPRGASIYLQTGDGAIDVGDVASVYARSETGEVLVKKASRSVEAVSFSGAITVENSTGRMLLRSVGGAIAATNLRPNDGNDCFEAGSISGEIELEKVAHQQVTVKTTNGTIDISGPLAEHGQYIINTTTSDVTLNMPTNASFKLSARIARDRDVTTDFPLKVTMEDQMVIPAKKASPAQPLPPEAHDPKKKEPVVMMVDPDDKLIKIKPAVVKTFYSLRRINGVHGSGDASISITSFSGNIHLIDSGN